MDYQEIIVKTYFNTGISDIIHIYPKLEIPYKGNYSGSSSTLLDMQNGYYYSYSYAYIDCASKILNVNAKNYIANTLNEDSYLGYNVFCR